MTNDYFYKSGDLVRWLADGTIDFLGRIDQQVKIRGFRIELEEIQAQLLKHDLVKEAVIIDKKDESGEKYLCAYVVLMGECDITSLKSHLAAHLPNYMIPSYFVSIDRIPLNANGKVNREELPKPVLDVENHYEAPRSEVERKLVKIWADTLKLDKEIISIHDNFFERGGHSLKAAILVTRIREELGIAVPLLEIFKNSTIIGLGQYIESSVSKNENKTYMTEGDNLLLLRENAPGVQAPTSLFFIHAGSGEVEVYIELCKHLDSRYNCWGLRVDRVDRINHFIPLDLSIPGLAAKYIKAIKQIQPNGPYIIIGWCAGGTIAFEMTRQLEQNGEKPGTLCLVNSYAPFAKFKTKAPKFNIASELNFLKFLKSHLKEAELKKNLEKAVDITHIWQKTSDYLEQRNVSIEMLKKALPKNIADAIPLVPVDAAHKPTQQDLREFIYYVNILRSIDSARNAYKPQKKRNMSKSNAGAYFFGALHSSIKNKKHWSHYFAKPLKFYEITGDHYSIFKSPNVTAFAEQLNWVLSNQN
jgi:thioesterase domain-containing protein/acyl carrier protein